MAIDNPCFCIALRKGVSIIAFLDIIFGFLGAFLAGFGIATTISVTGKNPVDNSTTVPTTPTEGKHIDHAVPWLYLVLSLFLILCIVQMAFGFVLITGLKKEKLLLLKAWLAFKASGALFSIGIFVGFIFLGENATIKPSMFDAFTFLYSIYCLWVVITLVKEIKTKQTGPVKPFRA